MGKQWMAAAGYLSIFLVPTLFLTGSAIDRPWLAFGVVIVVFPLARVVFGALPAAGAPEWRESVATALDSLPVAFAVFLPVAVLWGLEHSAEAIGVGAGATAGTTLSLWMTLLFGTCVAHELIHRRDGRQAVLGFALAGFCGYPALGMEHLAAHSTDRGHPFQADRGQCSERSRTPWVGCLSDGLNGRPTVRDQPGTLPAISVERGRPGCPRGAFSAGWATRCRRRFVRCR